MFFKEEELEPSKWVEIALRVTWAAVCFGKQFLCGQGRKESGWVLSSDAERNQPELVQPQAAKIVPVAVWQTPRFWQQYSPAAELSFLAGIAAVFICFYFLWPHNIFLMLALRIKLFHAILGRLKISKNDYFFSWKLKKTPNPKHHLLSWLPHSVIKILCLGFLRK